MGKIKAKAPAKLNIRLKVVGRRQDGYHELVSIMIPVGLYDFVNLKTIGKKAITISCEGLPVPSDQRNLAYRAAELFMDRTGIGEGVSIELIKNIPVSAGLGGGSSDAAAVLMGLNKIYSSLLSYSELHELSILLGADVPFFLDCRPSLASGIGEILEPIEKWPEYWYLIVTPPIHISTSWVYSNHRLELTTGEYDYILRVLKNDTFNISRILENDLEKVTSASFPVIEILKNRLLDAGAEGAIMSGSGPSVFGLFLSFDQALMAKEALISQDMGDVSLVKALNI